jgi:excisionase family DNA binding protein
VEYPSLAASHPAKERSAGRPELIDIEALAVWLGVEVVFVRRLVAERRIPFLKIGKYVRFDPDEVRKWIDERRVSSRDRASDRHGLRSR